MIIIPDNEKIRLEELTRVFDDFKQQLESCDYTHENEMFLDIMREFRKYIASIDDEKLCEIFMHSKDYEHYCSFFKQYNDYYMRALESAEAVSVITRKNISENNFVELFDRDHIRQRYLNKAKELQTLDFSHARKIVMVGCGPMPETILYISENTGISEIIGLDNSKEAIYISSQIISTLGFEWITLIHIDGADYDYHDADIVYIAWFVSPKKKVLDRIAQTAPRHVQILVDSPINMLKMVFEDVASTLNGRLKIVSRSLISTLYYRQEMIKIEKFDI